MFGVAVSHRRERLARYASKLEKALSPARVATMPPFTSAVDTTAYRLCLGALSAVGTVRITDHMRLVVDALERGRPSELGAIKGQFAVVVWLPDRNEIVAARDPVGVNPIYFCQSSDDMFIGDTIDACGDDRPINLSYVARFITGRGSVNRVPTGRTSDHTTETIRVGVLELKPGHWLRWKDGVLSTGRFWRPDDLPKLQISFTEAAARFRELMTEAVRLNIDDASRTWAHLSGGLDSSSVVSVASAGHTGESPLGGTITLRDSLANGDDSEFVGTVVDRYRVRNIVLDQWWPWQADGVAPPATDRPARDYPFFARDRTVASVVAAQGGTALLSGVGPDVYLPQTATHCSDLIRSGRLVTALKELRAWSVRRRGSLWRDAVTEALLPLVSPTAPGWLQYGRSRVPQWFTRDFDKRFDVSRLLATSTAYRGRRGGFYQGHIESNLNVLSGYLARWRYSPGVEIRHPLMHQPLIEFCYGLPWHMKTDVYWSKPLLRTAMKGILPEAIRTRAGATLLTPRILWAFRREQDQLQRLLAGSVLAQLGCIEPRRVQAALRSCDIFRGGEASFMYALLSMETWLSVRSGRWHTSTTTAETWR